jgi:hypothetical protein
MGAHADDLGGLYRRSGLNFAVASVVLLGWDCSDEEMPVGKVLEVLTCLKPTHFYFVLGAFKASLFLAPVVQCM